MAEGGRPSASGGSELPQKRFWSGKTQLKFQAEFTQLRWIGGWWVTGCEQIRELRHLQSATLHLAIVVNVWGGQRTTTGLAKHAPHAPEARTWGYARGLASLAQ